MVKEITASTSPDADMLSVPASNITYQVIHQVGCYK